jgi:hypothetical protein
MSACGCGNARRNKNEAAACQTDAARCRAKCPDASSEKSN